MANESDFLIRDYAWELAALMDNAKKKAPDAFEQGRQLGLMEAASVLLRQARVFDADFEKLGLGVLASRDDIY